jgi:putative hemolysin
VTTIAPQIVLLLILLILSGFFSGSETALFSLKPYQIRKLGRQPSPRSVRVAALLSDPMRLLVTILVGNTLVNVAASSVGTNVVGHLVDSGVVGISVAAMSILILIFGEIVPKTYAVHHPLGLSLRASLLLGAAVRLMSPLRALFTSLSTLAGRARIPGVAPLEHRHAHVVEAVDVGHSEGVLDGFEREMLGGFIRIERLSVQNIMTPRTEVFMLDSETSVPGAVSIIKSSGFSRVPLFETGDRDLIKGVVYVKDLLHKQYSENLRLRDIARTPLFVPESKPLVGLLNEFVSGSAHFAVVVDEYGTFTGIVTLDDIIEEIIGEQITPKSKNMCMRRTRSTCEVSARMELEYFNALLRTSLVDKQAETIGGYILNRVGRIPAAGEEFVFEGVQFRILDADSRQIKTVRASRRKR